MESAANNLETKFQEADSKLKTLESRVVQDMATSDDDDQKKRAEVIEKVKAIRESYNEIVKEANELRKTTQDTMNFFKEQIGVACSVMGKLGEAAAAPPGEAPDTSAELKILKENFGVDFSAASNDSDTAKDSKVD